MPLTKKPANRKLHSKLESSIFVSHYTYDREEPPRVFGQVYTRVIGKGNTKGPPTHEVSHKAGSIFRSHYARDRGKMGPSGGY